MGSEFLRKLTLGDAIDIVSDALKATPQERSQASRGSGSIHPEHEDGRPAGLKRFLLVRSEDASGVSGTGNVASGVQFPDGVCVMRWNTSTASTAVYDNVYDVEAIHGHEGRTTVRWLD